MMLTFITIFKIKHELLMDYLIQFLDLSLNDIQGCQVLLILPVEFENKPRSQV